MIISIRSICALTGLFYIDVRITRVLKDVDIATFCTPIILLLYKSINFLCDSYFILILIFLLPVFQVMDIVEYETISHYVNSKSYPVSYTKVQKRILRKKAVNYKLEAGKLVRPSHINCLLVIQCSELEDIHKEIHDNTGHQCPRKLI